MVPSLAEPAARILSATAVGIAAHTGSQVVALDMASELTLAGTVREQMSAAAAVGHS